MNALTTQATQPKRFYKWSTHDKRAANLIGVTCILIAEKDFTALVDALRWSEQFNRRPGEGYTECFERIGEVFYRETGQLRPGKDASPMAGASMEERQALWDEWIAAGIARGRAALASVEKP